MEGTKKCGCGGSGTQQQAGDPNKPRDIQTETMVTPDDFGRIKNPEDGVTQRDVDESTVLINPDVDSMESRG